MIYTTLLKKNPKVQEYHLKDHIAIAEPNGEAKTNDFHNFRKLRLENHDFAKRTDDC